jgi:hypothetical protein
VFKGFAKNGKHQKDREIGKEKSRLFDFHTVIIFLLIK